MLVHFIIGVRCHYDCQYEIQSPMNATSLIAISMGDCVIAKNFWLWVQTPAGIHTWPAKFVEVCELMRDIFLHFNVYLTPSHQVGGENGTSKKLEFHVFNHQIDPDAFHERVGL